ncbi:efflux RND transporter periplasmic adaptor subunit [uncultured Muribaculum sp.]|uniref:efflux RND transporter periplasmic adaptor subunit n=1 Tax=uncultured Muribaculum sp. TaxID=1918613 RepID=UPI0025E3B682|nr:efflux RND transporter periplasmic adaptor subunit [uncultured Muribaculum sp.]
MKLNSAKTVGTSLIAGATMILASCGGGQQQQQMPVPQIATMTVEYGNSELESAYPVTIKGRTDIAIRPQVSGFITKVHVDEGQQVHKGQVLFTLDQVQFQAAVDAAQAAVRVAESAVSTARLTADNKRRLYDKNIISEYEWQMADNQLKQAQAQLASAKAQLVTAQKNLAYTVVTAPSDGVIGSIPNREGSLASPSSAQPLTTVSDNSEVYAYFSLNEKDILGMTENGARSLNASVDSMPAVSLRLANGEIYPEKGKVATVSGVIDNTTGAATVRALFKNPSGMLRSGSTGSVLIPNAFEKVIIIPQGATSELQNIRFAYVVNDSNKVVATPIQVSPISDGKNFIVVSGLEPGQRIAVEGVGTAVRDGMTIQPVDAASQQPQAQQAPEAAKE